MISQTAGTTVVLLDGAAILFAEDDAAATIDVSTQALVQLDSAPSDPSVSATVYSNLFQRDLVGLRGVRAVTWARGRTAAVRVLTGTAYV